MTPTPSRAAKAHTRPQEPTPPRKPAHPATGQSGGKNGLPRSLPVQHITHPLSTEKSIRLMENENTLMFAVRKNATKADIKINLEELLGCKVAAVRTHITNLGQKRAYVQFTPETPAIDIATNLGIM